MTPSASTSSASIRRGATRFWITVLAPIGVALLLAAWLIWVNGDPGRKGSFCTNPTLSLATIAQLDATPAADLLPLVSDQDLARLKVHTPADLRADAVTVARAAPAYRETRRVALDHGRPVPQLPPPLAGAFARLTTGFTARCLTPARRSS